MRVDKFLKNARLIKRRTVAKEACEQSRIFINGKQAKPGADVKEGDEIMIQFAGAQIKARVKLLLEHVPKDAAQSMYEIIDDTGAASISGS